MLSPLQRRRIQVDLWHEDQDMNSIHRAVGASYENQHEKAVVQRVADSTSDEISITDFAEKLKAAIISGEL